MKELDDLIQEFRDLAGDEIDPNGLMYLREQIAGQFYFVGSQMGTLKKMWKTKETAYEKKKIQTRMKHINLQQGKGDTLSRFSSLGELEEMSKAESEYYIVYNKWQSAKEVLNALNQRIAWLKDEEKFNRFTS